MLIVTNISCLDGGKKSVLWRLGQLLEVMDELCRSQNDFFSLYLKLSLHSLGFGVIFWVALDKPFQSLGFTCGVWEYLWRPSLQGV